VIVAVDAQEIRVIDGEPRQWVGPRSQIRAVNLSRQAVTLAVSMHVQAVGDRARVAVLEDEQGETRVRLELSPGTTTEVLQFEMSVPPGATAYELNLSGDPVQLRKERRTVSGEISSLEVRSSSDVRAVSLQQQVASGVVVP